MKYELGIKRGLEIWTGYKTGTRYKTRTADCGLRTGYKYGLRTTWVKTVLKL